MPNPDLDRLRADPWDFLLAVVRGGFMSQAMQTIKQPEGSGMCAVCVAAMATNTTVDDVYDFMNDGRIMGDPIHDPELAMYLLKHGWALGKGWNVNDEDDPANDKKTLGLDDIHYVLEGLAGVRAYISVRSRNYEGVCHAVYWDGAHVRDPDPKMPEECELSDYILINVWPLTWMGFTDLTNRITLEKREEVPFFVKRYRLNGPRKEAAP